MRRGALIAALATAAWLALAAPADAQDGPCTSDPPGTLPPGEPGGEPIRFGTYPLGVAGQVGLPADPVPDDVPRMLAALERLRGHPRRPFVVHLYRAYMSEENDAREERRMVTNLDRFGSLGFGVEYVLRFRRAGDVDGYVEFVRGVVRRHGDRLTALQITNEVNFTPSPDSSDGAYEGARDALIRGVIAAKDEARRLGYDHLEIGFNWLYRTDTQNERSFWEYLRDHGGPEFVGSLDYVGLDAYPGTFFPPSAPRGTHGQFLLDAFSLLRKCYLPTARIPQQVPIHVQENGFPTGPGRSYEDQLAAMESMLGALLEYRRTFNVTDHRWFAMRDADSGSPNFQQQYGMLRDDYAEKPAFDRYRRFVEENGPPPREPEPPRGFGLSGRCYSRGVLVSLAGRGVLRVEFRVRGKRARDRRPPFRRHVRLRRGQPRRVPLRAYVRMNDGSLLPASGRGPRCPVR